MPANFPGHEKSDVPFQTLPSRRVRFGTLGLISSIFQTACLVIFMSTCLLISGCQESTTAVATPRNSDFTPEFFDGTEVDKDNDSNQAVDPRFSFLSPDHFGCVSINVANLISNPQLKTVSWQNVEIELVRMLGSNGRLENIERIWVVVDKNILGGGDDSESGTFVIVTKEKVNVEELGGFQEYWNEAKKEIAEQGNAEMDAEAIGDLVAEKIADHRIAISNQAGIDNLIDNQRQTTVEPDSIAARISKVDLEKDISGSIVFAPLQDLLKQTISTIGAFSADVKKFENLPDDLKTLDFEVSLTDKKMLVSEFVLASEQYTREIASMISNGINNDGGGGGANGMGPGMLSSVLMGGGRNSSGPMYEPLATEILTEVGKEITRNGLFNVEATDTTMSFQLDRPTQTDELIQALANDAQVQLSLLNRSTKIKTIASALKEYNEKYDCMPPAGLVTPEQAEKLNIPAQLNWRVGLLPMLGEQELYDKFDCSKPWDAAPNLGLKGEIPNVFQTLNSDSTQSKTTWQIPTGKGSLYSKSQMNDAPKGSVIKDRKIWTVLLIETPEKDATVWTEPGLFPADPTKPESVGRENENGFFMVSTAFKARIAKKSEETIRALLSIDGDENLTGQDFMTMPGGRR